VSYHNLDRDFFDKIELCRVDDFDRVGVDVADDDLSKHRTFLPNDLRQLAGVHTFDSRNALFLQPENSVKTATVRPKALFRVNLLVSLFKVGSFF